MTKKKVSYQQNKLGLFVMRINGKFHKILTEDMMLDSCEVYKNEKEGKYELKVTYYIPEEE